MTPDDPAPEDVPATPDEQPKPDEEAPLDAAQLVIERDFLRSDVESLHNELADMNLAHDALVKELAALSSENATLWKVVEAAKALPREEAGPVMTAKERASTQKEIQGLQAKLRWPHLDESVKDVYRARIDALQERDA